MPLMARGGRGLTMSEYQYYVFEAVDRPLGAADRGALRAISSRAEITATRFTNHYEWGDFKGDPVAMVERWFDLHLYFANWGTRRLMIRLPADLVDHTRFETILRDVECAEVRVTEGNLVLDILRDEVGSRDDLDDGTGHLPELAPLRAALLDGDYRALYLLWLTAIEMEDAPDDEPEPLSGIAPMTEALEAFATFFDIDPDLVGAAAERTAPGLPPAMPEDAVARAIAAIPEGTKTDLLARLFYHDPHVGAELRHAVLARSKVEQTTVTTRTAGQLRARAQEVGRAREQAAAERAAALQRRQEKEAEEARKARIEAVARRGNAVWPEIDSEIKRRNPAGYDRAARLLADLKAIATARGDLADYALRLNALRDRHARKGKFIERIEDL